MTIAMPDSIRPQDMPKGYPAYLAYVDGERSKDADQVRAMFPGTHILTLTVLGGGAKADGCDMEPGDLSPASAADWLWHQVTAGVWRPVLYASRDSVPRVLQLLGQLGVGIGAIRILSAHYGEGQHICSPSACGAAFTADGTQWTDRFRTPAGALVDMSTLDGNFFGAPAPSWTETIMQQLPVVRQGQSGDVVRTVQGLLVARGYPTTVDGAFGPQTESGVAAAQAHAKIKVDGIVGPQTWPVLLGL